MICCNECLELCNAEIDSQVDIFSDIKYFSYSHIDKVILLYSKSIFLKEME